MGILVRYYLYVPHLNINRMKIDLKDTTFIIPVRIDSIVRMENLMMCVNNIIKNFHTNIEILEAASYKNGILSKCIRGNGIIYTFLEDKDPVFYKTRYLNILIRKVKTPVIGIWDADIIIDKGQITKSIERLRNEKFDVVYPYNGDFMDTSDVIRELYWKHQDIRILKHYRSMMKSLYSIEGQIGSVGGAIFVKTDKYISSGGENERFYGWGMEDGERHQRWLRLGYKMYREDGCLFHLSHPRDMNGNFRSPQHKEHAICDMNETSNMTRNGLEHYIRSRHFVKQQTMSE